MPKRKVQPADYLRRRALWLPEVARYDWIMQQAATSGSDLPKLVIDAMTAIEDGFEPLKGVLPRDYGIFEPKVLEDLMRLFKDYFCSVILERLEAATADLVFRGGTCLAKVHVGFYRLSEDLDFLIPTPVTASRAERSRRVAGLKDEVAALARELPGLRVTAPLTGANDSTQYAATLGYHSMLGSGEESVKIEVGLREPLLTPSVRVEAQTLLLDPVSGTPLVSPLPVTCLSRSEAMAEKLRAALSRREAAVRDFYDVDHAVRLLEFQVRDTTLIELVKRKLAIPGNEPVDVSANRRGGACRTAGDGAFRQRTGTPASGWASGWSVPAVRPSG